MKKYQQPAFDFEEWKRLAEQNPEEFEKRRTQVTKDFIATIPEHKQHRLNCLQWRIDMERRKHKNPLQSCVQVYNMMWNAVYGESGLANALNSNVLTEKDNKSADILKFRMQ